MSASRCRYHKLVHTIGPEWYPADKCKQGPCSESEYCIANMTKGYEYLNSLWLRSTGAPFMSDPEEPSALALAWMFAFTVGAIFTDVTDSVEELVEEAWNEFVAASEDVVMGILKYVLKVNPAKEEMHLMKLSHSLQHQLTRSRVDPLLNLIKTL
ncbi:hypothetical protein ROHU_023696 [Labeo rohita]|uniref:Uncharacterized protein n=1 Tax=Labeo rohita TaxID=84645 RepID=A0A498MRN9_LABRO|nr:hypothetical protein ROHU_023696 [Labeo rohita]